MRWTLVAFPVCFVVLTVGPLPTALAQGKAAVDTVTEEAFRKLKIAAASADAAARARREAEIARNRAAEARQAADRAQNVADDLEKQVAQDQARALAALLEIRIAVAERDGPPKSADDRELLAQTFVEAARARFRVEDLAPAAARCAKGIALYRELAKSEPANAKVQQALANSLYELGRIHCKIDDATKALDDFRASIEVGEKLLRYSPKDKAYRAELAETYRALIDLLEAIGERQQLPELNLRLKQIVEMK